MESSAWFVDYSGTMQQKLKKPEDNDYPAWLKDKDIKDAYEELLSRKRLMLCKTTKIEQGGG